MSRSGHAHLMARTYSTGSFARIVDAGGDVGFMNLGYAPDPVHPTTSIDRQRNLVRLVVDAISPRNGQVLLDAGCGKGGTSNLIGRRVPGIRVVGVNIDRHQLRQAALARAPGTAFVSAAAETLPFKEEVFDTIVAVELLSHVPDKAMLAAEFARVLRAGGRVVIAYIALSRPYADFDPDQRAHLKKVAALFYEHPWEIPTRTTAQDLFRDAGFRLVGSTDLSDGVFAPRHEEFLLLFRRLSHANPVVRILSAAMIARKWGVRPREFAQFLQVNIAVHPCRFYEYHLMELVKDARNEEER